MRTAPLPDLLLFHWWPTLHLFVRGLFSGLRLTLLPLVSGLMANAAAFQKQAHLALPTTYPALSAVGSMLAGFAFCFE